MRCIVTAGPTWEPLDRVRRLTNFSTGSLGGTLANALAAAGHEVILLLSESATWRQPLWAVQVRPFSTAQSLAEAMTALADPNPAAVFHVAAVSDFTGGHLEAPDADGAWEPLHAGKANSRQGPLRAELVPTPKILARLRDWFPRGGITGWKYEVDGSREEALARGATQLDAARSDACVVNGPACGPELIWLRKDRPPERFASRSLLVQALVDALGA
ncbi:MAG: DNA/pantothenate metabolism flavoprotein domain protein [Verrucomicrobiae bacterium]|nr:DNA/pantothenate metabolism flavoprotein domain protein [Verrucomicrobiae bacterium]